MSNSWDSWFKKHQNYRLQMDIYQPTQARHFIFIGRVSINHQKKGITGIYNE